MAERIVVWTKTAELQRRKILKYWTKRNRSSKFAEKLLGLIRNRIEVIKKNPLAGKATNHIVYTRESAIGAFSLYYQETSEKIIITAFWDNRQNSDKLLEILSKKENPPS